MTREEMRKGLKLIDDCLTEFDHVSDGVEVYDAHEVLMAAVMELEDEEINNGKM